jgi:phage terminase large subunit-like protein
MTDGNGGTPQIASESAVGFLRVFRVRAKREGVLRWEHDVVASYENDAVELAKEFVLTEESLRHLAVEQLTWSSERAQDLSTPYGWVIGVRP